MSLLLPVLTMILIAVGAFCIFMAMENDRKIRKGLNRQQSALGSAARPITRMAYDREWSQG